MSIRYLNAIFEAGPALGVTPTELLVLHVLADHADEAGDSYPGIDLITHRCGSTRRQSIQAAIAKLEAAGLVIRTINGAHDSRIRADRRPNLYHLTILDEAPDGVTQTATPNPPERGHGNRDPEAATGSRFPLNGVTVSVERGHALRCDGVTQTVTQTTNEPPLIPHLSVCQDAQPIQEATETETDDGPTTSSKPEPLPANWTLDDATRTALAEHHPNVDLDDQADRFRDYWTANPTRRSDWSAMFRNWVRTSIDRGLYRALTDHPATPATDDDAQWVDCYECHGSRWPDHPEWADDDGRCNAPGCINGRTERQPADQGAF